MGVDRYIARVSGAHLSQEQDSNSSPDTLDQEERAILEYSAEGLGDSEIAVRLQLSRRVIAVIRDRVATKLAARISTAHPFRIGEVVLSRSLDSVEP